MFWVIVGFVGAGIGVTINWAVTDLRRRIKQRREDEALKQEFEKLMREHG